MSSPYTYVKPRVGASAWSVEMSGIISFCFAAVSLIAMIIVQVVAINVRDTNSSALVILGVEWVIALVWAAGLVLSSRSVLDYSKDIFGVSGVALSILQPIVGSAIPYFHSFSQMAEMLPEIS